MVSLEAHKVTRGSWILKSHKPEPVATNFKFFFPFPALDDKDVPKAVEYIGQYLRVFPSEQEARSFAGRVVAGEEGRRPASAPARTSVTGGGTASGTTTTKKEIKIGMTPLDVINVLGKPEREVAFENKTRWTYPDLTVIFENGRVKEVKF
jgi:hypothetical protein